MEFHQLRYMIAVARTRNFSRAAEQCHVSQPSLSQQIQKLEDELGERLFERLSRDVRLTAHGETFLLRALRIVDEVEAALREASDAKTILTGTATVGVLPTIAPYFLPAHILKFAAQFPEVELIIQEDTTGQLLRLAASGEIDFAIASTPIADARFEMQSLFAEELFVALPRTHALARKKALTIAEIEAERFIVMKEGHCLGEQVLRFCDRRDLRPTVSFRSAQLETIQALVVAGMGISFIPAMARKPDGPSTPEYRPLQSPKPQREIVALWPKQRPPSRCAAAFLESIAGSIHRARRKKEPI